MRSGATLTTFWAKIGSHRWPDHYHPLLCHMLDVGLCAKQLFTRIFRPRIRRWLTNTLNLPDEEHTAKWLAFWIGAHDIGKACPGFQFQKPEDSRFAQLRAMLPKPTWSVQIGEAESHAYVSTAILQREWTQTNDCWPALSVTSVTRLAVALGGHHGLFPTNLDHAKLACGNAPWQEAQRELLQELARLLGIPCLQAPTLHDSERDHPLWMYIAGLTSVADWLGSNKTFFKEAVNATCPPEQLDCNSYVERALLQANQALDVLGWTDSVDERTSPSFVDLFNIATPRDLQTKIEAIAKVATKPALYIVEAPMGEGKTEAAWYVANCWDCRGGQGTYVALPTMATSNQMYGRVAKFLEQRPGVSNVQLLHGKAQLNEKFERLNYQAEIYDAAKEASDDVSGVVAESWFASNKKHGLLAPFGVGTIDQALMAVLQTKHVFVRLFGLAGKCVILDEVHAYDAYMSTLLERLLQWLAALGCPVVLLSATLPKARRQQLLQAYSPEVGELAEVPYPRLTVVGGQAEPCVQAITADPDRSRKIALEWHDEATLATDLGEALTAGGCICVIRNTVAQAQELFVALREEFKGTDVDVELFHARFPFGRRKEIEEDVLEKYGKGADGNANNPKRPKKSILVATQVVEQSLDLDFDLMVSDVAPVDLVLQRAGRLWRHARMDRQTYFTGPTLWLLCPEMKEGLPRFGSSEHIYERYILLRSYAALETLKHVQLPNDLEPLVESVYGDTPLAVPDDWQTELERTLKEMNEDFRKRKRCAKQVMIHHHESEMLFASILADLDEDNPEAHPKIRAATRDTEPNVQLILVYEHGGKQYLDEAHTIPFSAKAVPNQGLAKAMLQNEISLSDQRVVFTLLKLEVPKSWQKHGMFRYHRLLVLDHGGCATVGQHAIHVDQWLGVRIPKEENSCQS